MTKSRKHPGKLASGEILVNVYPRFSPNGGYLMYLSKEKAKESTTDFLRMDTADGAYKWTVGKVLPCFKSWPK